MILVVVPLQTDSDGGCDDEDDDANADGLLSDAVREVTMR